MAKYHTQMQNQKNQKNKKPTLKHVTRQSSKATSGKALKFDKICLIFLLLNRFIYMSSFSGAQESEQNEIEQNVE